MRTLVRMEDILEEYSSPAVCPRCGLESTTIQSTVELSLNDHAFVTKKALCPEHGYFSYDRSIKTVKMFGNNCQILPKVGNNDE